jgi:hypothetical protein
MRAAPVAGKWRNSRDRQRCHKMISVDARGSMFGSTDELQLCCAAAHTRMVGSAAQDLRALLSSGQTDSCAAAARAGVECTLKNSRLSDFKPQSEPRLWPFPAPGLRLAYQGPRGHAENDKK